MIASGAKSIEVRTRRTRHRGPLLIVSGRRDADGRLLPANGPLFDAAQPTGAALCIVDLIDCRPMTPADADAACIAFRPDHYAWVLANPRPCPHVDVRGMPGLFDWPVFTQEEKGKP
jgi:hypothetical protein